MEGNVITGFSFFFFKYCRLMFPSPQYQPGGCDVIQPSGKSALPNSPVHSRYLVCAQPEVTGACSSLHRTLRHEEWVRERHRYLRAQQVGFHYRLMAEEAKILDVFPNPKKKNLQMATYLLCHQPSSKNRKMEQQKHFFHLSKFNSETTPLENPQFLLYSFILFGFWRQVLSILPKVS